MDFLELAYAAGGTCSTRTAPRSTINSPENLKALEFMVNGIKDGAAPEAVVTMMEEESQRAFVAGRATYLRNWPYVYAIGQAKDSKVRDEFEVVPYPPFEGGKTAGILGGLNLVISAYAKNPGGALAFVDFATNQESMNRAASQFALPPALASSYDDPGVQKALPFAAELKQAVEQAQPRPVTPVYTPGLAGDLQERERRAGGAGRPRRRRWRRPSATWIRRWRRSEPWKRPQLRPASGEAALARDVRAPPRGVHGRRLRCC